MDDYYDEPPPPVPTFSEGSHGPRGAGSKAAASRASASKSAVSAASRASAIMAASIQQLPKNSIITSNGIRDKQQATPTVNKAAIEAIQKKLNSLTKNINTPKPPEMPPTQINTHGHRVPPHFNPQIVPRFNQLPPNYLLPQNSLRKLQEQVRYRPPSPPWQSYVEEEPKKQIIRAVSEPHKVIVRNTLKKKEEMLKEFTPRPNRETKKYGPVKYITIKPAVIEPPIVNEQLNTLRETLATVIQTSSNNQMILDAFKKYNNDVRISTEYSLHKNSIDTALTNKKAYFVSDA